MCWSVGVLMLLFTWRFQAKLNSGKGKIKGGRKSRGHDNPYGDNADDMFFDRNGMQVRLSFLCIAQPRLGRRDAFT